jgi:hypothetical protein
MPISGAIRTLIAAAREGGATSAATASGKVRAGGQVALRSAGGLGRGRLSRGTPAGGVRVDL